MSADARRSLQTVTWQTVTRACAIPIPRDQLHPRGGEWLVAAWRPQGDTAPRILLSAPSTAFLVSPRHVMTAAHALPPDRDPDVVYAFGYTPDAFRSGHGDLPPHFVLPAESTFRVRAVNRRVLGVRAGDYAVIELDSDVPPHVAQPLPFAPRDPWLGEPVALAGHADGQPVDIRDSGADGTPGGVLGFDAVWLDHSIEAGPGWSGAPVVDAQGCVLAVHTGTAVDAPLAKSTLAASTRRMRACRVRTPDALI